MKKNQKYWQRRLGNLFAHDIPPYWYQLDLRPVTDLNDEGLAFILSHIRGVRVAYLNGTSITNEGIGQLASLEHLHELHLENNPGISQECGNHLARINGLEILNLNNTSFLVNDLYTLPRMQHIRMIYITDPSMEKTSKEINLFSGQASPVIIHVNHKPSFEEELEKH